MTELKRKKFENPHSRFTDHFSNV